MMNKDVLIGSHVSMCGPDFYLGSVKEAIEYGESTFMFYTGAPQNTIRKPVEELKVVEARKLLQEAGFNEQKIIVHAPYLINLANLEKPETLELSKSFLINELQRVSQFGLSTLVLHPGSAVGREPKEAIEGVIKALDEVFSKDGTNVRIAIETMAGKGSEVGRTFEEVASIIKGCKYPNRLGVCLDTCHINDAGYDLSKFNEILDEFDTIIGLDNLLVIHLNDSKNEKGAHKDRHENIGFGTIGFDILASIVSNPRLTNVPKILETPYINGIAPYKKEIEMLVSNSFDPTWRDSLL